MKIPGLEKKNKRTHAKEPKARGDKGREVQRERGHDGAERNKKEGGEKKERPANKREEK